MKHDDLTAEELRSCLCYDPETGLFWWIKSRGSRTDPTKPAGTINGKGYRYIGIEGKLYRANRLAVLYMTGSWPESQVDHIDMTKSNDAWENLRCASSSQNRGNMRAFKNNGTGIKGVHWKPRNKKYCARITVEKKELWLGLFKTSEEAALAYNKKAVELFGEFARLNPC